jgi:hypothetical protein
MDVTNANAIEVRRLMAKLLLAKPALRRRGPADAAGWLRPMICLGWGRGNDELTARCVGHRGATHA